MIDPNELLKIFGLGVVLGAGPCLLTCLPVLIPCITAERSGWNKSFLQVLVFSFARVIAYIILSILSVSALRFLMLNIGSNQYLYAVTGIFMIILGATYALGKDIKIPFCRYSHKFLVENGYRGLAIAGFLVGISPCAPLLSALTYISAKSDNVLFGALYGAAFGLGTVISPLAPLGIGAGALASRVKNMPKLELFIRIFSGLILAVFGLALILQAL